MIDDQITKRVRIIQRIYIVLACFAGFIFISKMTRRPGKEALEYIGNSIIFAFIYIAVFMGLKKQRSWVIPLILITSIMVLIQTIPAITEPAFDITAFMGKVVQFLIIYFYWYQAFFFSRREVKQYFGSKGTILF